MKVEASRLRLTKKDTMIMNNGEKGQGSYLNSFKG